MKEKLALFDLDGTLFDTGDVNYYAYKDALSPYGIELDRNYFIKKCNGRHYKKFLPEIMGTSEHLENVHKSKKQMYAVHLDKAKENTHLFQMISNMKREYYIAVVTTASRKNTLDILEYFKYDTLFDLIVTQEDIKRVKPDPEGFLLAMEKFGIDASGTIIFEDSDVGIQAAKKTGATVLVVEQF